MQSEIFQPHIQVKALKDNLQQRNKFEINNNINNNNSNNKKASNDRVTELLSMWKEGDIIVQGMGWESHL